MLTISKRCVSLPFAARVATLSLALNGAAFAQDAAPIPASATPPISLADAISSAQLNSPILAAAQARIEAAQARLRGAAARVVPQIIIAHGFGRDTGGLDEDLLLSQTFELGKRGPRVRSARALGSAATFERDASTTQLQFDVESAYFEALRAQSEVELSQNALQSAQTFDAAARDQLAAGDVPRANVVRSGIEVSRATQALSDAQTERDNRFATLQSLLGQPAVQTVSQAAGSGQNAPLQLADTLQFSPVEFDEAALQTLAQTRRADIAGARALQTARSADVEIARSSRKPDAFVEARKAAIATYSGVPNGQSVRVGISVPLGDGARRSAISEAQASGRESAAALQEAQRVARLDVATALATLRNAARSVTAFQNGRLDRSKELLDMAQIGYSRGANSYLELIDAQTVYRTEQASYARALADWNVARAALKRAVGGQLP